MSTPLTAPKPDMPTGSSNPVSWKSWFTKIGDWIAALSPTGATAYDTGWQTLTVPANWLVVNPVQYRRIGNVMFLRGIVQYKTTGSTIATMPAGLAPSGQNPVMPTGSAPSSQDAQITVNTGGTLVCSAVAVDTYVYLNNIQYPLG